MAKYSNKFNKDDHRVYSLNYHMIFVVKYRKKIFVDENNIINDIKNIMEKIAIDFNVNIIEQECGLDHIHILFDAKPTLDIPKFINILKSHSSRFLRKEYKQFLQDKLWGDSLWSPSYFISSTGNVSLDTLKEYVENQRD